MTGTISRGSIDVLGGHKLSRHYLRKLLLAKTEGRLEFSHLGFCDEARHEPENGTHFTRSSYADFILERLHAADRSPGDSLIPDHTAPHVFFRTCLDFIEKTKPLADIVLIEDRPPLGLPFEMPTTNGVTPLSYATWVCPLECEEPQLCPGINKARDWDFGSFFKEFERNNKNNPEFLFLGFACEQLVDGVAHIPWSDVMDKMKILEKKLAENSEIQLAVATYSHCHAILGEAVIGS